MEYSIGEISKMFNLNISTLRYYDGLGLLPGINKRNGIRVFGQKEIEELKIIECLKKSGLKIEDIKNYFDLCAKGSETYRERYDLFLKQKENVLEEIEHLKKVIETINFKLWYYAELINGNTEEEIKEKDEYKEFIKIEE